MPDVTNKPDVIAYLDFDGTLTGVEGRHVIDTPLCINLSKADTLAKRAQYAGIYLDSLGQSEHPIHMTLDAVGFLNALNKLHPHVEVVIISRNHENYIKGLLEFEGIDTSHITIYPRGTGKEDGLGEIKDVAVQHHERNRKPGLRLIADDFKADYEAMFNAAKNREGNTVIGENAKPGMFTWGKHLSLIVEKISHLLPVTSYLNGSTGNRFHLFSANANNLSPNYKEKYAHLSGDDLKRALLHQLTTEISKITTRDELQNFKTDYMKSPEYLTLAKGQGLTTRLFSLKTDSLRAVEAIFKKQELSIQDVAATPKAVN